MLNEIEQKIKTNSISQVIKNDNYKSKFEYGVKEDGTLYWKIEKTFYKNKKKKK